MSDLKLAVRQITGDSPGPRLLITGGVHGDEFEAMAAIRQLARQVDRQALRGSVTLVPVVNEAAFLRGQRTADDHLDLARTCPGRADGTVTERTAHALSELIQAADYYIDLHSGGTIMSVWPLAGYTLHPDPDMLAVQRRMARAFNLPVVWGTDPSLPGRSLSVARDARVPAIYAEYLGSGLCSDAGVAAYVQGCQNVMVELNMLDGTRPASQVRHAVEDRRESSGHMQVCHPAPQAGFFEPAVSLGDRIETGQLLGTVSDVLGDEVAEVRASFSGLVLALRTFSRVMSGDSLGVVLEDSAGDSPPAG